MEQEPKTAQSKGCNMEAEMQTADEAAYLQYLNERNAIVLQAREKYPEEYAAYQKRESERAKRVIIAAQPLV